MLGIKLVLLVTVFAAGALCGAVPLRSRARADASGKRLLEWGNAFAAGVFLGAGFVHMLPDANEAWARLGWSYPIGFLLAAAAVVGMLLFEHVLPSDETHQALHAPSSQRFSPLEPRAGSPRTAYAIVTALSIHSLLEGLALGAQHELRAALVIFAAIVAHKSVEGFALGVSLARNAMPPRRAGLLLGLFAAATPAGILLGSGVESLEGPARLAFEATFLALAAGSFAYVATLDILREEFHNSGGRFAKWAWVTAGLAAMALLAIWV